MAEAPKIKLGVIDAVGQGYATNEHPDVIHGVRYVVAPDKPLPQFIVTEKMDPAFSGKGDHSPEKAILELAKSNTELKERQQLALNDARLERSTITPPSGSVSPFMTPDFKFPTAPRPHEIRMWEREATHVAKARAEEIAHALKMPLSEFRTGQQVTKAPVRITQVLTPEIQGIEIGRPVRFDPWLIQVEFDSRGNNVINEVFAAATTAMTRAETFRFLQLALDRDEIIDMAKRTLPKFSSKMSMEEVIKQILFHTDKTRLSMAKYAIKAEILAGRLGLMYAMHEGATFGSLLLIADALDNFTTGSLSIFDGGQKRELEHLIRDLNRTSIQNNSQILNQLTGLQREAAEIEKSLSKIN